MSSLLSPLRGVDVRLPSNPQHLSISQANPSPIDCKNLAPIWEEVAADFAGDKNVVIAKVDAEAENSKATANAQGVTSYPTIKFFPRGSTEPEAYTGGRTEQDILAFVNSKAGTHRVPGGGLDDTAGTVAAFDKVIKKLLSGGNIAEVAAEAGEVALSLRDLAERKYAEHYIKVISKVAANKGYAAKELKRLQGLLSKGNLAKTKEDEMTMKSNILRKFLGGEGEVAHEEL